MSYVQGTRVRLFADFSDPVTRVGKNPEEVILLLQRPDGTTVELTRSGGEILPDPARAGRFFYVLEADQFGTWRYQFEDPSSESAVGRKSITVTRRLSAA